MSLGKDVFSALWFLTLLPSTLLFKTFVKRCVSYSFVFRVSVTVILFPYHIPPQHSLALVPVLYVLSHALPILYDLSALSWTNSLHVVCPFTGFFLSTLFSLGNANFFELFAFFDTIFCPLYVDLFLAAKMPPNNFYSSLSLLISLTLLPFSTLLPPHKTPPFRPNPSPAFFFLESMDVLWLVLSPPRFSPSIRRCHSD